MADTEPGRGGLKFEEKVNRNNKPPGSCTQGINKILLVLVVCLAVAILIVIAVLIWRESIDDRSINKNTLQKFYPGYFRTEEEQLEFERKSVIYVPVKKNFTSPLKCGFNCVPKVYNNFTTTAGTTMETTAGTTMETTTEITNGPTNGTILIRKRRAAPDTTFNGCCQSSTFFISPAFKDNLIGVSRQFVTLDNAFQFFQSGSCQFAIGCTGCTCMMSQEIDTAVVYKHGKNSDSADDIDDTEIDTFYFSKCCKCINVGS